MTMIEKLQNFGDKSLLRIDQLLSQLNPRERVMVVFTMIFALIALVGSLVWYMHTAANAQEKRLKDLKENLYTMQNSVAAMKPQSEGQLNSSEILQRVAQQVGLSTNFQENDGLINLEAQHENYAVLANFLTQMTSNGLSIEKMELKSEMGQIKLTASVK